MKRTTTRWGVGAAGVLALAATTAGAQPMGMPPGRWWERPRVVSELGLTADQRRTLDEVALAHAKTMVDLKGEVEKAELDVRVAADAEPFEAQRVRDAFAVLQQKRSRLETERFEMLLKVRQVLSAEQWRKLTQFVSEIRRGMQEREQARPLRPRF